MRPSSQPRATPANPLTRIRIWYACLLLITAVFVVRLFYLQIIRHSYYQQAALRGQLKQYEIEPERGTILAHNNGGQTPIVLNQTLYTVYTDPKFVKNIPETASAVQKILGGNTTEYEEKMKAAESRYEILAKKVSKEKRDELTALKLKGVGAQETNYRTYPQGQLAAQVLGFVNDEGDGQYGLEEALNEQLKGKPGQLKAITDAQGVPLAANRDNIVKSPENGKQLLLTIDLGMQQQLEDIIKQQVDDTKASKGSAVIIEAKTGAVKAMANYPTFNPADFYNVTDQSVFSNSVVTDAFEVGSIMKTLTAAAALDTGSVGRDTSYYDPSFYVIDEATVRNIEEDGGAGTKNVADILQLSLNTGASWLLMQMGGGQINEKARTTWYNYLVDHYQFGKMTGIEQSGENAGTVPGPTEGFGLNIRYANMAFGQGQTETILQMGAAISAAVNGGTYYKPHLLDGYVQADGSVEDLAPTVVKSGVVSATTSQTLQDFMEYTIQKNKVTYGVRELRAEYSYGGKTGTAEIANPNGGYYEDRYNGTFLGYVGGDEPEYIIVVSVKEPRNITGYAGAKAAAPVYFRLADMLINNFGVKPRS
jgi:stage V sporulation protein D (sporulation-specific penicillin-binding protein)